METKPKRWPRSQRYYRGPDGQVLCEHHAGPGDQLIGLAALARLIDTTHAAPRCVVCERAPEGARTHHDPI